MILVVGKPVPDDPRPPQEEASTAVVRGHLGLCPGPTDHPARRLNLVQANGFGARGRRRQVDRAGHQREAQVTSPTRPWHIDSPWTAHLYSYQRFPRGCDDKIDD